MPKTEKNREKYNSFLAETADEEISTIFTDEELLLMLKAPSNN